MSLSSENLDSGSAEERATFGLFSMTANERLLTEGVDNFERRVSHGPHVSGYPLAEWVAWNWWRIRWELGRPVDPDAVSRWDFAHRLSTVGDGYAWPNITIFSDGLRSFLISDPSENPDMPPFRYLGAARRQETVPARSLEEAMDGFVEDVLDRLEDRKLRDSNLHRLWHDLTVERGTPALARLRRLEAQLGCDPDEADEQAMRRCLDAAALLGEDAMGEVVADAAIHGPDPNGMISASAIMSIAKRSGFDTDPESALALVDSADLPRMGEMEAWQVGERTARAVRVQERMDGCSLTNARLAELAATKIEAISDTTTCSERISFVLDQGGKGPRLALRSRWETGRRFDLARLMGDRLLHDRTPHHTERLFPATRAYSYRQKMQRAFAAELLSPFASVAEMLQGDYSEESQNAVAEHFNVSPMTIRTQLVNHRRIGREDAPDVAGRGL